MAVKDEFSEALAGLESEQFHDGDAYRRDEAGNVLKGDDLKEPEEDEHDEKVGDREAAADNEDGSKNEPENDDEDEPEEKSEDEDEDDEDEPEEQPKDKKKPRFQRRIDALTGKITALEAALAERDRKAAIPKDKDGNEMTAQAWAKEQIAKDKNAPKKPDPASFKFGEFDDAYREAYDDYLDERRGYLQAKQDEFAAKHLSATSEAAPAGDDIGAKAKTFRENADNKKVDGFEAAMSAAEKNEWDLTVETAALVMESEVGADLFVHLHKNPKLAKEIAALPVVKQALRIGQLEQKFLDEREAKKKAAKKPSKAPAPIGSARGGGGEQPKGYGSENFDDVEKRWNTDERKRAGR